MKHLINYSNFIKENCDTDFDDCEIVDDAISKAKKQLAIAKQNNDHKTFQEIKSNFKEYLDSQNYNWEENPNALDFTDEFLF